MSQEEILKAAADAAVQRKEAAEATATPEERIAIQHAKAARAKDLRKKQVIFQGTPCLHGTPNMCDVIAARKMFALAKS